MSVLKWLRLRQRPANDARALPADDAIDLVNRGNRPSVRDQYGNETELLAESATPVDSVARTMTLANTGDGIHGDVFGIGDYFFELNATDGKTPTNVGASPITAQGSITVGGVGVAGQTFVVAGVTYTFRAIADYDATGEVGIPAVYTAGAQASYIATAINGSESWETANAYVTAVADGAVVRITARNPGAGGTALTLTEATGNLTVSASTLGGNTTAPNRAGVNPQYFVIDITTTATKAQGTLTTASGVVADDTMTVGATVYTFKAAAAAAGEITIGGTLNVLAENIIAAINGTDSRNSANASVTAAISGSNVILTAITGGVLGNAIVSTETFTGATAFGATSLGDTTLADGTEDSEVVDAIVAQFVAGWTNPLDATEAIASPPFTVVDSTNDAVFTSTLHGSVPNGYVLLDAMANAGLTETVAGIEGTKGMAGAGAIDATNIYVLLTANAVTDAYVWKKVAHGAV
tara:strand:+ start:18721 stop:20121 length:1401 start_codon:yes stop_codon:yes gene_type:complete